MLRETGRVVAVEESGLWVETIRSSACGRCAARAGCGHGALSGALGVGRGLIRVRDGEHALAADCQLNDSVEIELPESAVLIASVTVYGLPLILGVVAALAASSFGELASIAGFATGIATGFFVARKVASHARSDSGFEPRLVRRLAAADTEIIATSATL